MENQHARNQNSEKPQYTFDKRATSVVGYFGWIGLVVALVAGDREGAKFHLNQALILNLSSIFVFVPVLGLIWSFIGFILLIIGVINAYRGIEKELPIIGKFRLIK